MALSNDGLVEERLANARAIVFSCDTEACRFSVFGSYWLWLPDK